MPGRMEEVVAEHRAIADAVIAGDGAAAAAAMRAHLDHVLPMAEAMSATQPAYFTDHLSGEGAD